MHSATIVDRAVIRFAATGEGQIEHDPPQTRLRAGLHDAMIRVDRNAQTLTVLHIYRARR